MSSLGDYTLLKLIGKGSYGEVHLIQHKKERKQYVIKKMSLQKASKRERKAAELEAKLLSKLKHPNIVSYKDSFESDDGNLYIVMGYAEGGDLYTRLREQRERNELLSEVQVVRWFIQICMALQYLHQQHILHRDLKTQNIFLTKTKMIKVGDLGIARVLEGASDMATTLIGTPYYMSPELFSNRPYNHKSDVWALGCCVYEMTTLKHAFNAKDMNSLVYKILKEKMPKMPDIYSPELCDLIKNMLHQNADKRPSVNKILRNSFIKKHIQLFLDESSRSRRPTSGKSRSSTADPSSRRTSTSSVQSRCSSRESNSSVFESKPQVSDVSVITKPRLSKFSDKTRNSSQAASLPKKEKAPENVYVNAAVPRVHKAENENMAKPNHQYEEIGKERLQNNSDKENLYVNVVPTQSPAIVTVHSRSNDVNIAERNSEKTRHDIYKPNLVSDSRDSVKTERVKSADSAASSSSEGSAKKVSSKVAPVASNQSISSIKSTSSEVNSLRPSSEEGRRSSKSPERVRVSSARERRRREKQKKASELKASKSSTTAEPSQPISKEQQRLSSTPDGDRRKDSNTGEEVNQFFTLLHTTLKLTDQDSPPQTPPDLSSGNPPSDPFKPDQRSKLSPVVELSESSISTVTEQDGPTSETPLSKPCFTGNTPKATETVVQVPPRSNPSPARPITQATLASTGRLMDRIVALRKECIRALGVPLLHRAYGLLDENSDEDELEARLIELLGEVRYKLWAGKIWQLKFCEESIFKHCGSITAY